MLWQSRTVMERISFWAASLAEKFISGHHLVGHEKEFAEEGQYPGNQSMQNSRTAFQVSQLEDCHQHLVHCGYLSIQSAD